MSNESFLSRRSWGLPHYLWIGMLVACGAGLVPQAAIEALKSNSNRAEDWLPASYTESAELRWFRDNFSSGSFLVCTWPGCTLGNTEQLDLLIERLAPHVVPEAHAEAGEPERVQVDPEHAATGRWFRRLVSGPSVISQLTGAPLNLSPAEAAARLEGSLVSPRATNSAGEELGDASRQTCLVLYLAPEGYRSNDHMRAACDTIERIAAEQCGIPRADFHLGGPPADNVAIDRAAVGSFARLLGLSGVVGMVVAFWCYRNVGLTMVVVMVGSLSAGVGVALVHYFGIAEKLLTGIEQPHYGHFDAVLMTMPAVVYVLGISGGVHIVNYYLDARNERGVHGAAERAVQIGWGPCALAALTTAVGLGSLFVSDIIPIKKFGAFTAVGVLTTLAVMFSVLPVYLHRFRPQVATTKKGTRSPLDGLLRSLAQFVLGHRTAMATGGLVMLLVLGLGLARMESSVQVLKLLDPESDLIADYSWIEKNLANIVPMEVVLTIPERKLRTSDEHAEADREQYRLTMLERIDLVRRVVERIESLAEVSGTMSPATFARESEDPRARFAVNRSLERNRESLDDYLVTERTPSGTSRELWRIAARVAALQDVDYGQFVGQLRAQVEPVLRAYRQRDRLVRWLQARDGQLQGARVCLLFNSDDLRDTPDPDSPAGMLGQLLKQSSVTTAVDGRRGAVTFFNLRKLDAEEVSPADRDQVVAALEQQDAVVLAGDPLQRQLAEYVFAHMPVPMVDLTALPALAGSPVESTATATEVPVTQAVYTGIVPLVFKTQRQLMVSLRESILWAVALIAVVMAIVLRNPVAGTIAMVPNIFPIVAVFGALGWLGVPIDIGIMMTASVALGVAVDDTVHFLTWFRRGIAEGRDRRQATQLAYERCAGAMLQTTLVAGLGLAVFAASAFTPTKQFGLMMVTMLTAALVGDLLLLPALLAGPLGRFFEFGVRATSFAGTVADVDIAPPQEGSQRRSPVPAHHSHSPAAARPKSILQRLQRIREEAGKQSRR